MERRISQEGTVAVGGNQYSVPDTTRRRIVEVQNHPAEVRIFEDGQLVASHPVLEGKDQRRVGPSHRKYVPPARCAVQLTMPPAHAPVARRSLAFYEAVVVAWRMHRRAPQ